MAKKCPACNADNKDGALVCEYCGTRLSSDKTKSAAASEETRFCTSCGKPLSPDAAFCPFCGAKRNDVAPAPIQDPAARQVPIPPRTPVSQGLPDYMQPGYQQQVRAAREAERQAAQNASKTKKSTRGLSVFLALLLAVQFCIAGFKYPGFLRGKIGGTEGKTDGDSSFTTGEYGDAVADLLDLLGMTEEDLAELAELMPEVTPENSPGNPAFIDVTFTEAEYAAAKTLTAPVSWESPEADFPEFGIHVNMKPWNLEYEEDTLTVKQMPVKDDPVTGARLYIYDYSLVSGQHKFLTDVEITAPVVGDDFYGFVVFNEDTGKWESAYCELSEDGKTYTGYMPHFSGGGQSALKTIKTDAKNAVDLYKDNGKSIFYQLEYEFLPIYKDSSHYLYPVSVVASTDFYNFVAKETKAPIETLNGFAKGEPLKKESALTEGIDTFGSKADAAGAVNEWFLKSGLGETAGIPKTFTESLGTKLYWVGIGLLIARMADQAKRGVDAGTILSDNLTGIVSGCLNTGAYALTAFAKGAGATAAAGSAHFGALVLTAAATALFVYTSAEKSHAEYMEDLYPFGQPSSVQEAAYHAYLRDCAWSSEGYRTKGGWFRNDSLNLPAGTDKADAYVKTPQKLTDARGKGWADALDTLFEKYANDPAKLYRAYEAMHENFVDSWWNETYEVKQKYFRIACKRYITIGLKQEPNPTNPRDPLVYIDLSASRSGSGNSYYAEDWETLENLLLSRAKKENNANTDQVWNKIFAEWDADPSLEKSLIEDTQAYAGLASWQADDMRAKKQTIMRETALSLLKSKTQPITFDFLKKKRADAAVAAEKLVRGTVLPLLNTRLTFYTDDQSEKQHTFEELASYQFSFSFVGLPRFDPANADQVTVHNPLVLKANKSNKVLLETTVYHYLRFNCPIDVTITDEKQKVSGKADWDHRKLVTDDRTGRVVSLLEEAIDPKTPWAEAGEKYEKSKDLQKYAWDTQIPVKFELKDDEEDKPVQNAEKEDNSAKDEKPEEKPAEKKTGYWKLEGDPWSEESDALMNNIYKDATLSGSAAEGFTGTSTYLGDDYRLGVAEEEKTHEGKCTGEKGTAVTTFSQPPSILKPEEVLSVDVKVSYSKSDGHPQGVNLQTTVRFMWEPHASSYTYLRTDDDQYNIMPQQEHTTEGSKETGYHTYSSYSKNNEATLKGTVPKGNTGSQSDLYICFSGTLSAYQINTYYHYVWVEE